MAKGGENVQWRITVFLRYFQNTPRVCFCNSSCDVVAFGSAARRGTAHRRSWDTPNENMRSEPSGVKRAFEAKEKERENLYLYAHLSLRTMRSVLCLWTYFRHLIDRRSIFFYRQMYGCLRPFLNKSPLHRKGGTIRKPVFVTALNPPLCASAPT